MISVLLLVGILLLQSCGGRDAPLPPLYGAGLPHVTLDNAVTSGPHILDVTASDPTLLTVESAVDIGSHSVGPPADLLVVGKHLLVALPATRFHLLIVDRAEQRVVATGMRRDMQARQTVSGLSLDPADSSVFWAHEFSSQRLHRFNLRDDDTPAHIEPDSQLALAFRGALRTPVRRPNGVMLASAFLDQGLLAEFDESGRAHRVLAEQPYGGAGVPADVRHHMNFGRLAAEPYGARIAMAFLSAPRVQIHDAAGRLTSAIEMVHGREPFVVPLPVRDRNGVERFTLTRDMRAGFLDIAATPSSLYALYGGRRFFQVPSSDDEASTHAADASLGTLVLHMTWTGRIIRTFSLPHGAHAIAVSPDDSRLYASSLANDPIVVYPLPLLLPP